MIEEFFKALKTGCRHQQQQLESARTLLIALAIETAIAWHMLLLRWLTPQGYLILQSLDVLFLQGELFLLQGELLLLLAELLLLQGDYLPPLTIELQQEIHRPSTFVQWDWRKFLGLRDHIEL